MLQSGISPWLMGDMDKFPDKVRAAREAQGKTQAELAEYLGTAQPRVADWEGGKRTPNLKWLLRIARALDVTTDYLLDDALVTPQARPEIGAEEQKVLWAFRISGLSADDVGAAIIAAKAGSTVVGVTRQTFADGLTPLERKARAAKRSRSKPKSKRKDNNEGGSVPVKRGGRR